MNKDTETPVSVGNWMLTFLLMGIPVVNVILLFVWAFGNNAPVSKANWAKASLLIALIAFIIYVLLFVILGMGAALTS